MLKRFSGLILYLLITVFVVTIYLDQPEILGRWEMAIYDQMFKLRGKQDITDDVQIVSIDDVSVAGQNKWPWNRDKVAELIDEISAQNPKVIYLGMYFGDDKTQDSEGYTSILAKALKDAGNVVLPYRHSAAYYTDSDFAFPDYVRRNGYTQFDDPSKFEDYPPLTANTIYPPSQPLAEAAMGLGFAGVDFDADRYIRADPLILGYTREYLPSVPFVVAQGYFSTKQSDISINIGESIVVGPREIPLDDRGRMRINYNGPERTFDFVSALDVLNGTVGKKEFSGKIVLISYTGPGTIDLYSTPVAQAMYGIEITANTVENIIHNNFLKSLGPAGSVNFLVILLIGAFSAVILPRISLMYRFVALGMSLFVIANLSFVLFTNYDIITQAFYPLIQIVFFIIVAPMMKLPHVSVNEEEEDDEIDYDALLAGTPIGGTRTQVVTPPSNAAPLDATVPQNLPGPGREEEASVATMQLGTDKNGLPVGSTNFGRYQVLEAIGQGAMGMVYKGLDPAIDRPVALKTIRLDNIVNSDEMHELKIRLDREAKAAGQLSHPNIVTIYDVGEEQSMQYIAMEFLDGQTLEELIESKQHWNYKTLCKLMIQICEALDFAHERGIVHRDIKPANIMMLDNDRVKVMDFGIARLAQSNMTQSGVALGTPNYISPEQLKGQGIDRRSDIFSLGVVFYELLTEQKPFKGDTISALIYSILHTSPPSPSEINLDVPRIFDKIVAKALAKDPDLRFQTSREMADILRKLI
ncbi:MAG: CHASE2 domain-containing protein [candidate division Zixibacteria bacterium]|nr:CHASE2 domain-containing protein [candidate division Zixibacteria bacterium]